MNCRKCRSRPSTGVLIDLCDPCFDAWEADIRARAAASPDEKVDATDLDVEFMSDTALVPGYRSIS